MYTAREDKGQNLRTAANDALQETKHDLTEAANRAGRKVRHVVNNASDQFVHAKDTVTTQIRNHPVQSSVIALGVGVLLGALLRR